MGQDPVTLDPAAGSLVAVGAARAVVEPGRRAPAARPRRRPRSWSPPPRRWSPSTSTTGPCAPSPPGSTDARRRRCGSATASSVRGPGRPRSWSRQCGARRPRSCLRSPATPATWSSASTAGEILLNDRLSGAVWSLDSDTPTRLDDWEAFTQRDRRRTRTGPGPAGPQPRATAARPRPSPTSSVPARAARPCSTRSTTTAPRTGRVLSIRSVDQVPDDGAELTISPDGQTVQIQLPETATRPTRFEYVVDDGRRDVSAHATVTVTTRSPRAEPASPPCGRASSRGSGRCPPGGSVAVPVLPDWRDRRDGDPLTVTVARPAAEEPVPRSGRPPTAGSGSPRRRRPARSRSPTPSATAGSDAGVQELDLPGPGPRHRQGGGPGGRARHRRRSRSAGGSPSGRWPTTSRAPTPGHPRPSCSWPARLVTITGAQVRTDLADGTVAVPLARSPRPTLLDYDAAYGNAPLSRGRIRVDVRPRDRRDPVAMPDTATFFGPSATLVDVLANDVDPSGGLLVVQGVRALEDDQLDVAVVDGRWVRVSAREGELRPARRSSATRSATAAARSIGEISVTQRPVPRDKLPVTEVDRVTVRAGSAASIPVLDNDFSPSGDALSLVDRRRRGARRPALGPLGSGGAPGQHGQAFVAGHLVRYVAPPVATPETLRGRPTSPATPAGTPRRARSRSP